MTDLRNTLAMIGVLASLVTLGCSHSQSPEAIMARKQKKETASLERSYDKTLADHEEKGRRLVGMQVDKGILLEWREKKKHLIDCYVKDMADLNARHLAERNALAKDILAKN